MSSSFQVYKTDYVAVSNTNEVLNSIGGIVYLINVSFIMEINYKIIVFTIHDHRNSLATNIAVLASYNPAKLEFGVDYEHILFFNAYPIKCRDGYVLPTYEKYHNNLIHSVINHLSNLPKNKELYKLQKYSYPYLNEYNFKNFIKYWHMPMSQLNRSGEYQNNYSSRFKIKCNDFTSYSTYDDYLVAFNQARNPLRTLRAGWTISEEPAIVVLNDRTVANIEISGSTANNIYATSSIFSSLESPSHTPLTLITSPNVQRRYYETA